ncbi:MAG TPA: DUF6580 family putative transport protein [Chitinophagaceae bacterium]|nr:DUF6580 family putative transport protein [Chitinophagaceae bacterium]
MTKLTVRALIILVVISAICRVAGFAPQIAIALFAGAIIPDKKWAVVIPVVSIFLSDCLYQVLYDAGVLFMPGFYEGQWQNYIVFAALACIGFFIKKINVINVLAGALAANVVYFLASNFIVWAGWQGTRGLNRPQTWDGLMQCYTDALPFLRSNLISTLVFCTILFGGYSLLVTRKRVSATTTS